MTNRNPYDPPRSILTDPSPTAGTVSVAPYVLGSLAGVLLALLILVMIDRRFGGHSVFVSVLLAAVAPVCIAAELFGRKHHRQFLQRERFRFTFGCFLAFWFFDKGLSLIARWMHGVATVGQQLAIDIVATIVDLLIIWAVVRLVAPLLIRRHEPAPQTGALPSD